MNPKDKILDDAVKNHDVPFVVAATGDSKGITYAGAAGDATPGRKAGQDTVFRIFSMTKAVGSTAAMILIDRGKLDPESPVEDILPEFSKIKVLDGFDGDKPKLRPEPRRRSANWRPTPAVLSTSFGTAAYWSISRRQGPSAF